MSIYDYIADWDPMGYISNLDAPQDEYDAEAEEIVKRFKRGMSDDDIANLVREVFVEFMEIDPADFREECAQRASDIRAILSANA